jgi:hypothetical protein
MDADKEASVTIIKMAMPWSSLATVCSMAEMYILVSKGVGDGHLNSLRRTQGGNSLYSARVFGLCQHYQLAGVSHVSTDPGTDIPIAQAIRNIS